MFYQLQDRKMLSIVGYLLCNGGLAQQKKLPHFPTIFFIGEVPIQVRSPKGGAPKAVSLRVFSNLRGTHKYGTSPSVNNSLFISLLLSNFIKKNKNPWEHIKLGELPWHNALGFFCWGRSLKIHIEIKSELFMFFFFVPL